MPEQLSSKTTAWINTVFFALVSIGILAFLAWRVDLKETFATLSAMRVAPLALAVILAAFASYILGGYKWMRILAGLGYEIPYSQILFARLGSEPVKFVVPAKAGELIRPAYLKSQFDVPLPEGIGSLALDKMFNLFGLLVIFACGVALTVDKVFAAALLVLCFLLMALVRRLAKPIAEWLVEKEGKPARALGDLMATLHTLSTGESLFQLLMGIAFLFTEVLTGYLALTAAGVQVPFTVAMTYLPAVIIVVQIPVTISGIGTREAGIVAFFLAYASKETLLAVGIAYTLVELVMPVMIGLPWLGPLLKQVKWKSLWRD
jgi:uncharacterized membrane protein YbhN (UPF0104 family)